MQAGNFQGFSDGVGVNQEQYPWLLFHEGSVRRGPNASAEELKARLKERNIQLTTWRELKRGATRCANN
jgi:hypothetical protein